MANFVIPALAMLAAFALCLTRAIMDFRARRFVWGSTGLIVCGLLVWGSTVPIPTHAVMVDLPIAS